MSEEAIDKTFVELVLERMDTNPEEFIEGHPHFRWSTLVSSIMRRASLGSLPADVYRDRGESLLVWALTTEELDLLQDKYRSVYRMFLRREFLKNIVSGEGFAYKPVGEQSPADHYVIKGGVTTAANTVPTNTLTSRVYRTEGKSHA